MEGAQGLGLTVGNVQELGLTVRKVPGNVTEKEQSGIFRPILSFGKIRER